MESVKEDSHVGSRGEGSKDHTVHYVAGHLYCRGKVAHEALFYIVRRATRFREILGSDFVGFKFFSGGPHAINRVIEG
jgi:hypothetical protein